MHPKRKPRVQRLFKCMGCETWLTVDEAHFTAYVTAAAKHTWRYACNRDCLEIAQADKQVEHVKYRDLVGNWQKIETAP